MEMAATIVIHDTLSQEKVREEREGGGTRRGTRGERGDEDGETGIGAAASHLRSHLETAQG